MQTIERIWSRIQMLMSRGRVTFVNDAGPVQLMQIRINSLEVRDNTPRLAEYGFNSCPEPGCDVVIGFLGGDRTQGVVLGTNDQRYRFALLPGEVVLFDNIGQSIHLSATGISIAAPLGLSVVGNVTVSGSIAASGDVTVEGATSLHTHKHSGVTVGSSQSGPPV